jgi:hypothetical protein
VGEEATKAEKNPKVTTGGPRTLSAGHSVIIFHFQSETVSPVCFFSYKLQNALRLERYLYREHKCGFN